MFNSIPYLLYKACVFCTNYMYTVLPFFLKWSQLAKTKMFKMLAAFCTTAIRLVITNRYYKYLP